MPLRIFGLLIALENQETANIGENRHVEHCGDSQENQRDQNHEAMTLDLLKWLGK
jgi:hypothetical protein